MEPYKKVSCRFYDHLEMYAVQHKQLAISYLDGIKIVHESIKIDTLKTQNKEEFLVADNGLVVRLDHIVSLEVE